MTTKTTSKRRNRVIFERNSRMRRLAASLTALGEKAETLAQKRNPLEVSDAAEALYTAAIAHGIEATRTRQSGLGEGYTLVVQWIDPHAMRSRAAYHEAGHAVIAEHYGIVVDHLSIASDLAGDPGGYTAFRGTTRKMSRTVFAERAAVISFAGFFAEMRHNSNTIWSGCEDDFETAHRSLAAAGRLSTDKQETEKTLLRLENRSWQLVNRFWPTIDAVAQVLLKEEEISGTRLKKIVHNSTLPPRKPPQDHATK